MAPFAACLVAMFSNVAAFGNGLTLVKDGELGASEDGLILGVGTNLAAADDGRVFLLDPSAFKVRVFDADLAPIGSFGQRGKGPGEFEEPKSIALTPDGRVAVFDPTLKRLTLFDASGATLTTQRLEASNVAIYSPAMFDGEHAAFISAKSAEGKPVYDLSVYGADMKPIESLIRIQVKPLDWSQSSQPRFWVQFLKNEFELMAQGMPVMTSIDGETLVTARADRYRFLFYDRHGKAKGEASRELKPKPFNDDVKRAAFEAVWTRLCSDAFLANNMPRAVFERALAEAEVPPALPVIKGLAPLANGFVALVNYNEVKKTGQLDFFTREGELVGETSFRGPAYLIAGSRRHLYAVGANADDVIVVNRFHVDEMPAAMK